MVKKVDTKKKKRKRVLNGSVHAELSSEHYARRRLY